MPKVTTGFSMSLDGFVALPDDDVGALFDWYFNGDIPYLVPSGTMEFKLSQQSAEMVREEFAGIGALVSGRRLFEHTKGWGGRHPLDVPVFVVTHHAEQQWVKEDDPFTFVTDGLAIAIAQAKAVAGDKDVAIASTTLVQQCLDARLLDEIHIDLVPILFGSGIRLFDHLAVAPVTLERVSEIAAPGVTHLTYRVVR